MWKKKRTIIWGCILVFFIAIYIRQSIYREVTYFSDQELEWMDAYAEGDTVYFESDLTQHIDTMIITRRYVRNNRPIINDDPFTLYSKYIAYARFSFDIIHEGNKYDRNNFSITKNNNNEPAEIRWNILYLIFDSDFVSDKGAGIDSIETPTPLESVRINDKTFDDCIIGNMDNTMVSRYHWDSLHADEAVWSKSKGLIEYEIGDESFTIKDM